MKVYFVVNGLREPIVGLCKGNGIAFRSELRVTASVTSTLFAA